MKGVYRDSDGPGVRGGAVCEVESSWISVLSVGAAILLPETKALCRLAKGALQLFSVYSAVNKRACCLRVSDHCLKMPEDSFQATERDAHDSRRYERHDS